VANANHVVVCGLDKQAKNEVAYVLQSSAPNDVPHHVEVNLSNSTCSCRAGASEQCKHICAVHIYVYRLVVMSYNVVIFYLMFVLT